MVIQLFAVILGKEMDVIRFAGFVLNLPIKSNMRNLRIKIEKRTGLIWNRWQTIYDNRPILAQPHRKITHWGTTLNSKVSDDDVL